jgi:heterodisulfide reductase subunit A-like polyferredoxin
LNLGVDPTSQKAGVQYVEGDQVTIVNRENTKLTVEMKDTLDSEGKTTQTVSKIIYEIGDQKNGYNTTKVED